MIDHRGRKPGDPDYGLGQHTIDFDRLGLLDEQEITTQLLTAFDSPGYRPPRLPAVAMELLALSQQPEVEFGAVEALLERDAMLAGETLSLARSAFYAGHRRVDGIRQALVRLGLSKLREIIVVAAMNLRVFRSDAYRGSMERLQRHSQATAHLCRIVSRHTDLAEDHVALCGLLHDVGIAGVLLVVGEVRRGRKPPDLDMLWPAIHAAHPRAGARMVELWGLPPEVAVAVEAHHQVLVDGTVHPEAATVCLAEAMAAELALALVPGPGEATEEEVSPLLIAHGRVDRSDAATIEHARKGLGISEATVDLIRSEARDWARSAAGRAASGGTG